MSETPQDIDPSADASAAKPDQVVRPERPPHRRDQPVPAGYKRVYHGHTAHQGSKETSRRLRQREAAIHKAHADMRAIIDTFIGLANTPEVRAEIADKIREYVDSHHRWDREIPQNMADVLLAKMGIVKP